MPAPPVTTSTSVFTVVGEKGARVIGRLGSVLEAQSRRVR
jgi:hypothetical protein